MACSSSSSSNGSSWSRSWTDGGHQALSALSLDTLTQQFCQTFCLNQYACFDSRRDICIAHDQMYVLVVTSLARAPPRHMCCGLSELVAC